MLRRLLKNILPTSLYWRLRTYYVAIARAIATGNPPGDTKRLIIFLAPGINHPGGGVLSIASLLQESRELKSVHEAEVIWCTIPGDPPLFKYSWFKNRLYLQDLETVLNNCRKLHSLMIHIPEYAVNRVTEWISAHGQKFIDGIPNVQLNVLLQNIDQARDQKLAALKGFGKATCTTAHEAYSTVQMREKLGMPLHRMSVFISPEQYDRKSYGEKENMLIYSPDEHPMKKSVLAAIANQHPDLKLQMIRGLSYEEFKQLIARAKWSLTFGEGLDGYFAEPVFSGSVSFAVFNPRFFTPAFANLDTVYPSWDVLMDKIPKDLKTYDQPQAYSRCWKTCYDLLANLYDVRRYRENLRKFYLGNYTFP